jgi:hypothetical protein
MQNLNAAQKGTSCIILHAPLTALEQRQDRSYQNGHSCHSKFGLERRRKTSVSRMRINAVTHRPKAIQVELWVLQLPTCVGSGRVRAVEHGKDGCDTLFELFDGPRHWLSCRLIGVYEGDGVLCAGGWMAVALLNRRRRR